jgi:hypothetical protein
MVLGIALSAWTRRQRVAADYSVFQMLPRSSVAIVLPSC